MMLKLIRPENKKGKPVIIYSWGMCYLSACAPKELAENEVRRSVELTHPCGTTGGWQVHDPKFADGSPNPCTCNDFPDQRKHWLFSAACS